jgi:iron complex transport system substrate-binding protein
MRDADALTDLILREAIAIHRGLGPGLFESAYEVVLADSLEREGLRVERQVAVPIEYRGRTIAEGYRIDLLIDRTVVVECKSVDKLAPVHSQQILSYLRLGGFKLGLLLNFGAGTLKEGVKRFANDYRKSSGSRLRVNQEPPTRTEG